MNNINLNSNNASLVRFHRERNFARSGGERNAALVRFHVEREKRDIQAPRIHATSIRTPNVIHARTIPSIPAPVTPSPITLRPVTPKSFIPIPAPLIPAKQTPQGVAPLELPKTISILDDSEKAAVRTIVKALKKSRLPIDRLKKDAEALSSLRAPAFELEHMKIASRIKNRVRVIDEAGIVESEARKQELRDCISTLKQKRVQYQTQHIIPVYTIKESGELPDYSMQPGNALPFVQGYKIPTTNNKQVAAHIPTRKEMDQAVRAFLIKQDLLPWRYHTDGCYARAQAMLQQLLLMGIPPENLGKAYLTFPKGENWGYHVTPIVKLDTGEWVSVDPAMDEEEASTLDEWADFMTPEGHPIPPNLGKISQSAFSYDNTRYNLFTLDFDKTAFIDRNTGRGIVVPDCNAMAYDNLSILGRYRGIEVDIPFLDGIFRQ